MKRQKKLPQSRVQSIGSKVIVRRLLFFLTLIFLLGVPASIRLVEIQRIPTGDYLIVEKGQGINSIVDNLKNQNNNKFLTILKVKYLLKSTKIIPGRYEIKPRMTYVELLEDIFEIFDSFILLRVELFFIYKIKFN